MKVGSLLSSNLTAPQAHRAVYFFAMSQSPFKLRSASRRYTAAHRRLIVLAVSPYEPNSLSKLQLLGGRAKKRECAARSASVSARLLQSPVEQGCNTIRLDQSRRRTVIRSVLIASRMTPVP